MNDATVLAGRYQVRGILGRGGMAEVRDGWDDRLKRAVAIKLLHPALSVQPGVRDRFQDEARAAACLNHPNVVAVHDYGELEETPFIVMERLPGRSLADEIAHGPLDSVRVRAALTNILSALSTAHGHGILHRDIKPGNILLNNAGDEFKVADFGIAKTGGAAHTMTGQIVGTIAYMSPERLSGSPASVADDIYALGVVGYEALTGYRPFPQEEIGPLAHAILHQSLPPLQAVVPHVDPGLAAVIERAMSRDPARRFASADEMRAALDVGAPTLQPMSAATAPVRPATKVLDAPPIQGTYFPGPQYYPPRRPRVSKKAKRAVTASGVLAALTVTAAAFILDAPTPQPALHTVSTTTSAPALPVTPPPPPLTTAAAIVEPPGYAQPPGNGNQNGADNGNHGRKGPKGKH
jgi:serine/threonine-protein kinase